MTALLLTATIAPQSDAPNHTQFDPTERLLQYEEALRFYLAAEGPAWSILFVENSGHPLDRLRAIAAESARPDRPVHFLGYRSDVPAAWGKGRGEIGLIETAVDHFRGLLGETEPIWKITGRLKIRNIGRMVATQPDDFLVYADLRDVPFIGDRFGGNQWADARLFAFTPEGYDRCIRRDWPDKRGFGMEQYLFRRISRHARQDPRVVPRFRIQPRFSGVSGGTGKNYDTPPERAKTALRIAMRRLAPRLWL